MHLQKIRNQNLPNGSTGCNKGKLAWNWLICFWKCWHLKLSFSVSNSDFSQITFTTQKLKFSCKFIRICIVKNTCERLLPIRKIWSFKLRISLVNVNKSLENCGFVTFNKNTPRKTSFFVHCFDFCQLHSFFSKLSPW